MRKVYLIGTTHKYQCGRAKLAQVHPTSRDIQAFKDFLRSTVEDNSLKGITEEMSKDSLKKYDVLNGSIPFKLATEIGVAHRYCDADTKARRSMGPDLNKEREKYWIQQLIEFDKFPVLFILGADHAKSFQTLLSASSFDPYVVAKDWKPSHNTNTDA